MLTGQPLEVALALPAAIFDGSAMSRQDFTKRGSSESSYHPRDVCEPLWGPPVAEFFRVLAGRYHKNTGVQIQREKQAHSATSNY